MRIAAAPEIAAAHAVHDAEVRRRRAEAGLPGVARRNVAAVLDLGNTIFYTFRGRAYGVPPLPWHAGQRILDAWLAALEFQGSLTPATAPAYFAALARLPPLLWRHSRPVGLVRRALRAVGLHRNPLARATEGELVQLASFFLTLRQRSSVSSLPTAPDLARRIS